ncbi:hypothetical protein PLEOSDRAFT_1090145 [Pleurotus ostreatus PC15]|uniref:SHSP domain-containing protein n=1 Tax=Pleurotus ostreatus (strain PC15) TaxID=1137138 RepID=A0A067NCN6_PLEO1|nr:hypothetical protein PLEOSDRAFT_1090145 [Pleurotus ostreatus PC15]
MSLARHFFREFRPFFRMFEEPLTRSPAYYGSPSRALFDDPFFQLAGFGLSRPAIDVTEEDNGYVVEADLPGVKKENVEVRVGDGGRSLTIEGKITRRSTAPENDATAPGNTDAPHETNAVASQPTQPSGNQISTERMFTGSSTFTRTVWLPRPVDTQNVAAKLDDGILTIRVQKAEDKASVSIPID